MTKKMMEWIWIYREKGYVISKQSAYKRRALAGVGKKIGRNWYLTEEEFLQVLKTPLYGCKEVKIYGEI